MTKRLTQKNLAKYLKTNGIKPAFKPAYDTPAFNPKTSRKGEALDVEQGARSKPLGEKVLAIRTTGACVIRFKAFRKRLADSDGNCFKFIGDAIQRAGVLVDDSTRYVRYITDPQEKVEKAEDERVEVTIEFESVDLNNLWVDLTKESQ